MPKGLTVSQEISHLIREKGYPQKRAVAAALSMERRGQLTKKSMCKAIVALCKSSDGGCAKCPQAKACPESMHYKKGTTAADAAAVDATDDEGVEQKPPTKHVVFGPGRIEKAVDQWDDLAKTEKGVTSVPWGRTATLGGLSKADKPPGGGWGPIPAGKKGGFRKKVAGGYEYWYPGREGTKDQEPKAARHERHEELSEYNLTVVAGADGALSEDDVKRAINVRKKMKEGISAAADVCKISPPVCEGNLGIPRMHMPQLMETSIKQMLNSDDPEDRKKAQAAIDVGADPDSDKSVMDQFLDVLKNKGVAITKEAVAVGQLKATQREIKAGKTFGMADAFLRGKFKPQDAEILISSDNHILDGHHRWASLITAAPDVKMKVTRVDMPMKDFLRQSFQQAGVFRADLQGDIVDPSIPLDLSGKTGEGHDAPEKEAPPKEAAVAAKSMSAVNEWDDLVKAKYTRREGTPGNYRYFYDKPGTDGRQHLSVEQPQQQLFGAHKDAQTEESLTAMAPGTILVAAKKRKGGGSIVAYKNVDGTWDTHYNTPEDVAKPDRPRGVNERGAGRGLLFMEGKEWSVYREGPMKKSEGYEIRKSECLAVNPKSEVFVKGYSPDADDPNREWTHIGGDLEASYDGAVYVDIRAKGAEGDRFFISKAAVEKALGLFELVQAVDPLDLVKGPGVTPVGVQVRTGAFTMPVVEAYAYGAASRPTGLQPAAEPPSTFHGRENAGPPARMGPDGRLVAPNHGMRFDKE